MPIFRVKSVKIYTGQKKFTRVYLWNPWQIRGMKMASIRLQQARNNWSHWTTNKAKLNLQYLPKYSKKWSPAKLSMKISPQDMFALISNCSNYLILDDSYKLELVLMMRHHDLPFVADFDRWYTTKGESWPWISSFRSFVRRCGGNDG